MKKSFPKKLLSLMLAALMVVTSIPMFAVTASAAAETVVNELPCFEVDFMDSSIYNNNTYSGGNPTIDPGHGFTISSGRVPNGDSGGYAEYNSAGLKLVNGYADCGIAKGTLGSNFRIVLRANISSPMDTHERAIIALGSNGSLNNILSWTCGEVHVLSPDTVGGTAGDGTFNFSNLGAVYQNSGSFNFVIEVLNGTLTLKNNDVTLYTQANCGINGSDIDHIRIFDDDSWWGGYGVVEKLGLFNLTTSTCDPAALGSDIQYETTGYVGMDPVIYVHGTSNNTGTNNELAVYNTLGFYDYMMHGDRIADATVVGERETNVVINGGKQLKYVYVTDTNQRIDVYGGSLKGTMGGSYGSVTTTTTDSTATLCFVFTDGSAEYRKVAVKTNPVAQHIAAVATSYTGNFTTKKFRSASIKMVALASYGVTEASNSYNYPVMYNWSTTMNYWNYNKAASMSGKSNNVLNVDKKAGLMNSTYKDGRSNSNNSETFSSARGQYYIDLSKDTRMNGLVFDEASKQFSIRFFVGDIYVNQDKDEQNNTFFNGTTGALNNVTLSMSLDGDLATKARWSQRYEKRGFVTITGTLPSTGTYDGNQSFTISHNSSDSETLSAPSMSVVANMNYRLNVFDKSSLRDLYDTYFALNLDSRCYTAESWAAYKSAMLSADSFLNNYQADASDQGSFRSALETAKNNLTPKTDVSVHTFGAATVVNPTCTAQGYTTQTCTRCNYEYKSDYTTPTGHTYVYTPVADQFKHTITCQKGDLASTQEDCVDTNNDGQCDKCLQSLLANWTNYNQKVAEFKAAIQGKTFTQAKINEINNKLTILTYYNMTDAQKAAVTATYQTAIDNEAKQLAGFIPTEDDEIDTASVDALTDVVKDIDQYDKDAVTEFVNSYKSSTTVAGVGCYVTPYASQNALDDAGEAVLNTVKTYTVKVNNTAIASDVPYGTAVAIYHSRSGIVVDQNADLDADYGDVLYDWSYKYSSPTNEAGSNKKYVSTGTSFQVVVRGDIDLDAVAAADKTGEYKITYMYGSKVVNVDYTNGGQFTVQPAPAFAYYSFNNYSNGYTVGETYTATGDVIIKATYNPSGSKYSISYETLSGGALSGSGLYNYNEKVSISTDLDNFYCWVNLVENNVVVYSYEKDLSFFACEDLELYAITKDEAIENEIIYPDGTQISMTDNKNIVANVMGTLAPIYNGDTKEKVTLIGTAIAPEGAKLVEAGFLVARSSGNKAAKYFTVETCPDQVSRVKSREFTCGKQFVYNLVLNGNTSLTFDYCSYVIYEKADGTRETAYSDICRNVAV